MSINNETEKNEKIIDIDVREVTEQKYLDYSMSVIVDRALPDIRDGLKPVHRRILYSMHILGTKPNTAYKKSARIVGDVIGKYHPHGDTSVYEAMVRMAQPFSMRQLLIDGQGNFGSIDGDSPAAMRYTESRLHKFGDLFFSNIEDDTVDFINNYDGTEKIPEVLPVAYPNLVINGIQGIAVGMASNIPPHNPIESMEVVKKMVLNKILKQEDDIEELMEIMPAPDFPTGGIVHGLEGMKQAWTMGRGKVYLRAKWHEETLDHGRTAIIITELPYQVNKANLIKKIEELATPNPDKESSRYGKVTVEGIIDAQDESDKDGLRISIEISKDSEPDIVFNNLIKYTSLETSINYNNCVLINNQPKVVGLIDIFEHFIQHRVEVITRRTLCWDRKKAARQHILIGLIKALDPVNIEEVIKLIRGSSNTQDAKESLMSYLDLDEKQAESIVQMRLQSLTSTQIDKIKEELEEINELRKTYSEILSSTNKKYEIILKETEELITTFINFKEDLSNIYISKHPSKDRLSTIVYEHIKNDLAALTKEEESTIIYSKNGYIRRIPLSELESQNRGTRGKRKINLQKEDYIKKSINTHSHSDLLFISNIGKTYSIKAYEIPDIEKGRHIKNILETSNESEEIIDILPVEFDSNKSLIIITSKGIVKKTEISSYASSKRKGGIIGINLKENDEIIEAAVSNDNEEIILINSKNKSIRFPVNKLRNLSRNSMGVTGMRIEEDTHVIGGAIISNNSNGFIICITENGLIKITEESAYRTQNRGGKGIKSMKSNDRSGNLFKTIFVENLEGDIVVTTKNGITNRINISNINVTSRNTTGVKLVNIDEDDRLTDAFYTNIEEVEVEEVE